MRLAGEILAERVKCDGLTRKRASLLRGFREALGRLLECGQLKAEERVRAGAHLAQLGDPRPEVMALDGMQFCRVPEGPFFLGSTDADGDAFDDEKEGAGEYTIDYPYWLARYPVTVAQYRHYLEEAGVEPEDPDCRKGAENGPVMRVSWIEATAFCHWLTEHWGARGWLPEEYRVALPSEPEWEKGARGGYRIPPEGKGLIGAIEALSDGPGVQPELVENRAPQRRYPWGGGPDGERMNFDMNIGMVSAVGAYPGGASPYGCEELSGNALEWTRSRWDAYPYPPGLEGRREREAAEAGDAPRVLRGGSFDDDRRDSRCAARGNLSPDPRYYDFGFRVVLSPLL